MRPRGRPFQAHRRRCAALCRCYQHHGAPRLPSRMELGQLPSYMPRTSASRTLVSRPARRSLTLQHRMVAEPPNGGPFHRSASGYVVTSITRSDCYRLDSAQLPGGICTRCRMVPIRDRGSVAALPAPAPLAHPPGAGIPAIVAPLRARETKSHHDGAARLGG